MQRRLDIKITQHTQQFRGMEKKKKLESQKKCPLPHNSKSVSIIAPCSSFRKGPCSRRAPIVQAKPWHKNVISKGLLWGELNAILKKGVPRSMEKEWGSFQHHAKTKKATMPMMAATPGCAFVAGAAPGNVIMLEVGLGGKTVPVPGADRVVGASVTVVEEL